MKETRKGAADPGVEQPVLGKVMWILGSLGFTVFYPPSARYKFVFFALPKSTGIVITICSWPLYTTVLLSTRKIFAAFRRPGGGGHEQGAKNDQLDAVDAADAKLSGCWRKLVRARGMIMARKYEFRVKVEG